MSNTRIIGTEFVEVVTPLVESWLRNARDKIIEEMTTEYKEKLKKDVEVRLNSIAKDFSNEYGKKLMCEILFSIKEDKK